MEQKNEPPKISVETIMTAKVHCITTEMTIQDSIKLLLDHSIRGAPVVDSAQTVISVITEGDLLKLASSVGLAKTVGQCLFALVQADELVTMKKDASFAEVYKKFLQTSVHRIIITSETGKIQGMVSQSNVLRILYGPAK